MNRAAHGSAVLLALAITFPSGAGANPVHLPVTAGRVEAGGYLDGLAVVGTEGGAEQRPQGLGVVRIEGVVAASVRLHAELRGQVGGPFEGGHPGVFNLVHTFQNLSPSLEASEAYFDLRFARGGVQAGLQRFAWGKLDGIPPTDVLNPRDFHDPLVTDFEEAKIGIPALKGTFYPPDIPALSLSQLQMTLVYIPLAVPSRLPLLQERWFPENAVPEGSLVLRKGAVERRIDRILARRCDPASMLSECKPPDVIVKRDVTVPVNLHTANDRPPLRLDAGGIAFRLGGTWRDMDWDLYHYTGPETGPDATLSAAVATRRNLIMAANSPNDAHTLHLQLRGTAALRQDHSAIHMTGANWSAVIGGATVRVEAAFFKDRPYLSAARDLLSPSALSKLPISKRFIDQALSARGCSRQRPCRGRVSVGELFPELDSVEWGIGADYMIRSFFPLLQVNQVILFEPAPRLVINDPETRVTAVVRRRFFQERLEVEVRSVYALERQGWFVFPRASYLLTDDIRVRLGYLAVGGDRSHLIGQFRNNDEVVMQIRYSF